MLSPSRLARVFACAVAATSLVVLTGASAASAANSNIGFGFNARSVAGAGTASATITGGGAFDPSSGFVHAGGGFRCTTDVNQGPLTGCLGGEGVRWDTETLLPSTGFKCTTSASEAAGKTATTDEHTAVLLADFYRAGDGNDESFTAKMFVSDHDLAPDIDGVQNVWIQNVGCATAIAHFSS